MEASEQHLPGMEPEPEAVPGDRTPQPKRRGRPPGKSSAKKSQKPSAAGAGGSGKAEPTPARPAPSVVPKPSARLQASAAAIEGASAMYALGGMGFAVIGFGGAAFAMQVNQGDAGKILARHAKNAPWPGVYSAMERFGGTSEVAGLFFGPIVCELYVRAPGLRGMLDPMVAEMLKGKEVEVEGPAGPMTIDAAEFVRQALGGTAEPSEAELAAMRAEAEATAAADPRGATDPVADAAADAELPTDGPAM